MLNWTKKILLTGATIIGLHYVLSTVNLNPFTSDLTAARVKMNFFSELKTVSDVLKLVQYKYVEEDKVKDHKKLVEGAIQGILKKLDDPFSRYMPPTNFKSMQEETEGEFGGLGILLGIRDKVLTIISPMEGTPAFRAGVRASDKIIKINGKATEGMSVEAAVKILRGKPKTKVTISVYRKGEKELIDIDIIRDLIKVPSVKSGMINKTLGYARLTGFTATVGRDLDKAIAKMEKTHTLNGFILDLRGNPGGLLTAAVEVGQQFLPRNQTVVSIKARHGQPTVFKAKARKSHKWPLIVLIDGGSASASEIVAGAIKDTKRGILLGTKSFGKGSVQTVLPLADGSALALTTAYYYTPNDIKIHKIGIHPDIEVKFPKLTDKELKTYRDELEAISQKDYKKTEKKQDSYLKEHPKDSKNDTKKVNVIDTKSKDSSNKTSEDFMNIPKFDVQLKRAIDLLKANVIFSNLK
ncbi:MAG: peptidase S41 [Candidatus Cloacimonadota bacterium]|nr:MAG: peptidase S41 [Candidatus Cloacimonadota bacterium]